MTTEAPSAPSEKSFVTGLDPAHLAYLMGQTERLSTVSPRGKYAPPTVKPQRKAHVLSDLQREALEFLKKFMGALDETFTSSELKKAFRKAALSLHPDQGGSSEAYSDLRRHYQVLNSIFPTK